MSLAQVNAEDFLVQAIAGALRFTFYDQSEPEIQLLNFLRQKEMLLLLDNFEHLLAGVAFLLEILRRCPDVKLVVTSRQALQVSDEWLLPVTGLPIPGLTDREIGKYGAVRLFTERARQVRPDFGLEEQAGEVIRICRLVEGLPLALELAAYWTRVMSCQHIAAEIQRNLDFLATNLRDVPERHRSLRAVFEHSWQLLAGAEQSALIKLSVFRGGFTLDAARQVAGADVSLLAALADKSLIQLKAADRYDIHELLRQYAHEQLDKAGLLAQVRDRHLDYWMALAESIEPELGGGEPHRWFRYFETELDNVRAALTWSQSSPAHAERGLRLAVALFWFWHTGHLTQIRRWLEGGLAQTAGLGRTRTRGRALFLAASAAWFQGDLEAAREQGELSIAICHEVADRQILTLGLYGMAWYLRLQGKLDQSFALCEESVALAQGGGNDYLASASSFAAATAALRGDWTAVQYYSAEALRGCRLTQSKLERCQALLNLGEAALWQGDYATAYTRFHEAVVAPGDTGHNVFQAQALNRLAEAAMNQDDFQHAATLYSKALTTWRHLGNPWGMAMSQYGLGRLARLQGNLTQAAAVFRASLSFYQEAGIPTGIALCLAALADLALAKGQDECAACLLGAAEKLRDTLHSAWGFINLSDARQLIQLLSEELDASTFGKARAEGRSMTLSQAIAYASQCGS